MSRDLPPELINLFTDESTTRLTRLSEQLLALEEAETPDPEVVASVFRDAHTLKGSAGMMGFTAFAAVAHRMEDLLDEVRSGKRAPTSKLVDALLRAVDGLRSNLPGMLAGTVDEEVFARIEDGLKGGGGEGAAPVAAAAAAPVKAATARVPVARLEALGRLAHEASAAHIRLVSALADRLGPGTVLPPDSHLLAVMLRELEQQAGEARMVPFGTVAEPLRRVVREVAQGSGKSVRFEVDGAETELDRSVLDTLADALLHLVRNAVDHGVEPTLDRVQAGKKAQGTVRVVAAPAGREVVITVSDDGRGIDLEAVRAKAGAPALSDEETLDLLFQPGFSTAGKVTAVSGRGVGLDVVRASLAPIRGRVQVRSERGQGTAFTVTVPLTVAAVPSLVVVASGQRFALPLASVVGTAPAQPEHTPLASLLGLPVAARTTQAVSVTVDGRTGTFAVADVVGRRDVVVKGLGALPPVPVVAGAGVDGDGSILVVLDPAALLDRTPSDVAVSVDEPAAEAPPRVLVVDDAAVAREVESALLLRAGYEVRTADDGAAALAVLREWPADLAVVDVEMPVMDGLALTRAIRADPDLRGMAVLMVTSLGSEDDRIRGMEAGADGYVVKGTFTGDGLADAVARLLGRGE